MAEYDGLGQFHKAAQRRLKDARELLQTPTLDPQESGADTRHLRAAVYLAGYAVECALKEYIIAHERATTLTEATRLRRDAGEDIPDLLGANGHNLDLLLRLTGLTGRLDPDVRRKQDWGICLRWRSTWRYDPTPPPSEFATAFVAATQRVHGWIVSQI